MFKNTHVKKILFFLMIESEHNVQACQNCTEEMAQYTIESSSLRFWPLYNPFHP